MLLHSRRRSARRSRRLFSGPSLLAMSLAPAIMVPRLCHVEAAARLARGNPKPTRVAQNADTPDQKAIPPRATITGIRGTQITIDVGSDDGAKVGAVYGLLRDGRVRAQLQITQVSPGTSSAIVLNAEADAQITVGDAVNFIAVRDLPPNTAPPVTPPIPPTPPIVPPTTGTPGTGQPVNNNPNPNPGTTPSTTPLTTTQPTTTPTTGGTTPPGVGTGASQTTARVTAVTATGVTLDAGLSQGIRTGTNVPILRNGNVAAVLRVDSATDTTASATVLWSADPNAPVLEGDTVSYTPASAGNGTMPTPPLGGEVLDTGPRVIPATPVRFETGASDAVVPRADRTYEFLAGLAASGLITRYPASIFHDDGTRRHRTDEDITFTRAQIAGLVNEALGNAEKPSGRDRVALEYLTQQYGRELRQMKVDSALLQPFAQTGGFRLGISGQTRLSLVGGTTDNVVEPFSERAGGRRERSGLDVRTNIWGQAGSRLTFFGTVDSGTDPSRNRDDRAYTVRRALLSYNASKLLRGLTIEAGRDEYWFGPGHFGTLLLSDNADGLNSLHTIFKRGSYQVDSVYSPLGHGPNGKPRALYAKNIQVQLSQQSRIGFAESTLSPNADFQAPQFLATFSPFPIFYAERLANSNNTTRSGNILVQGYFESSIAKGMSGYGELLVDDIGVNANNNARNRIGTLLGAHFYTPKDPTKLGMYVEYTNLSFRTYLRFNEADGNDDYDYFYRGDSLGYPVTPTDGPGVRGAGAESLRFDTYWRIARHLRLGGGLEFTDINSEGPLLARQQVYRLRASYDISQNLTLTARLQRVATTNAPTSATGVPVARGGLAQRLFQLEIARAF